MAGNPSECSLNWLTYNFDAFSQLEHKAYNLIFNRNLFATNPELTYNFGVFSQLKQHLKTTLNDGMHWESTLICFVYIRTVKRVSSPDVTKRYFTSTMRKCPLKKHQI